MGGEREFVEDHWIGWRHRTETSQKNTTYFINLIYHPYLICFICLRFFFFLNFFLRCTWLWVTSIISHDSLLTQEFYLFSLFLPQSQLAIHIFFWSFKHSSLHNFVLSSISLISPHISYLLAWLDPLLSFPPLFPLHTYLATPGKITISKGHVGRAPWSMLLSYHWN